MKTSSFSCPPLRLTLLVLLLVCVTSPAMAQEVYPCMVGPLFNQLALTKSAFSLDIFKALGPSVKGYMGAALGLFLVIITLLVWVSGNGGHFKKVIPTLATFGMAVVLLNNGLNQNDEPPFVLQISDVIESSSLSAGAVIVSQTSGLSQLTPDSYTYIFNHHSKENGYAMLACQIERQGFAVAQVMIDIAVGDGAFGVSTIFRAFMCILAMLPFLFVVGIFGAFMLEAMFKYVAIAILAPFLIGFAWLKFVRTIGGAAMRVIAGAWLTIVLASGAMGFTLEGIDRFKAEMDDVLVKFQAASNLKQTKRYWYHCNDQNFYPNPDYDAWDPTNETSEVTLPIDPGDPDIQEPMTPEQCDNADDIAQNGAWIVIQPAFLIMPVIGFISILLHMQSKSLASNLSGANDGAGPAAAVVMGAKMLAGGAMVGGARIMGGANTAAFGQGGLRSSVTDLMAGRSNINPGASAAQQIGQAMHQHGLAGGIARSFGLQPAPPPAAGAASPLAGVGAGQYSTGGSAGSGSGSGGGSGMFGGSSDERKQFAQDIGREIAAAMNNGGNSMRNRNG